ncbi:TPA: glycosyltransferase, partial [Klebsiella pneumoniae]|nr:glycosyltransferase [Klebsiella pneumoniae]
KNPLVSVYISTYNRVDKLKRAISSVLNQDYSNVEVIICDDASTDGTQEYMEGLVNRTENIFYFRNEINKGACATRNLAIYNARGEFITGLDDDDEFKSNRISYFISNWDERYSFLCANFTNVYADLTSKNYYLGKQKELTYKDLLFHNEASNQIFTRTSKLRDIGGFDISVKRLQDWDTWLRLSHKHGSFLRLSDSTYIMHNDHSPTEMRVSNASKITDSLSSLMKRNIGIYSQQDRKYMNFLISYLNQESGFCESLYWGILKLNPRFIVKYFIN